MKTEEALGRFLALVTILPHDSDVVTENGKRAKYRLRSQYSFPVPVAFTDALIAAGVGFSAATGGVCLVDVGIGNRPANLIFNPGYAWDGPSGLTIDSPDSLRASAVHDAFYALLRERRIPPACRPIADRLFREILRLDGMNRLRRWTWYAAVRLFGRRAAAPTEP